LILKRGREIKRVLMVSLNYIMRDKNKGGLNEKEGGKECVKKKRMRIIKRNMF
jgi:hypothetical protein